MKTDTRKYRFIGTIIFILCSFACSDLDKKGTKEAGQYSFEYKASDTKKYLAILDSLNYNGYVPFFRSLKRSNFDFETYNIQTNDSVFIKDSISYYTARKAFFDQDKDFLYWLVNFKNDTIIDSIGTESRLWSPFIHPYSSSISPCSLLNVPKSRQAINLVYALLDGQKIECLDCHYGDKTCVNSKYEHVEEFLDTRRDLTMKELREEWK